MAWFERFKSKATETVARGGSEEQQRALAVSMTLASGHLDQLGDQMGGRSPRDFRRHPRFLADSAIHAIEQAVKIVHEAGQRRGL